MREERWAQTPKYTRDPCVTRLFTFLNIDIYSKNRDDLSKVMSIDPDFVDKLESESSTNKLIYHYCSKCHDKAWLDDNHDNHNDRTGSDSVNIGGVYVVDNVLSHEEEIGYMRLIDNPILWKPSQEGRCKQDFGPRVNFIGKKASVGNFVGFPTFAKNLLSRLQEENFKQLGNFVPVEFCILEYTPERNSYIRPHYDDTWIWGDRLVTVNLLSETTLRLTREYNIPPYEIAIKMPARSLVIVHGDARYNWHHSIKRHDIKSRRIAMTWREFSDEITNEAEFDEFVSDVLRISRATID